MKSRKLRPEPETAIRPELGKAISDFVDSSDIIIDCIELSRTIQVAEEISTAEGPFNPRQIAKIAIAFYEAADHYAETRGTVADTLLEVLQKKQEDKESKPASKIDRLLEGLFRRAFEHSSMRAHFSLIERGIEIAEKNMPRSKDPLRSVHIAKIATTFYETARERLALIDEAREGLSRIEKKAGKEARRRRADPLPQTRKAGAKL